MKKLLPFLLLLAGYVSSNAQSVSFSLTVPPCNNDGVLTINVTGLTPPLTVYWITTGTAGTIITHTTTGSTDALTSYSGGPVWVEVGGSGSSIAGSYAGAPPFTYAVTTTPAVCPALGTATATVSGGAAPYTYQWYDLSTSATVGTTNPVSLPAGGYGVLITDAAGCVYGSTSIMDSVTIYDASGISASTATTVAGCTNGTATVTSVTGGVSPLSYAWSNGASTASITGLTMGSYSVTVTDALGCMAHRYVYVAQSIMISAPITATPATCTSSDGAVIAFGSGGVPPYTYLWSNGATTASQTGLAAGYYGVTVTDANGCIGNGGTLVSTSTPVTVTSSSTSSLCTSATGTASIVPSGGTTPYSILWYTTPPQTTTTASSLAPGNYNFMVTDAVGCIRTGTVNVPPINIINASFTATAATCTLSNGGLTVYPTGGVTPYTYSWTTGGTASSISSVPAGTYGVTITDAMSCHVYKSHNVPVYSPVGVGVSSTPASCIFTSDGILSATAFGGTTPYTYSWTGAGSGSTGTVSGLPTGHYWLSVTDATGCTIPYQHHFLGYNAAATSCYCTIEGIVYEDLNGNCVQDVGEAGIPHVQMYCSGRGYTYTDASGYYSFKVPTGSYTISETILAFYPLAACQLNDIPVSVTASSGCVNTVNFANAVNPIHDMHISTWDYDYAVPGNTYHQISVISNEGTAIESTILSGYKPDGQLFAPSFVPSGVFTGSPYWYNTAAGFPTLNPGFSQLFFMNYSVPTSIPLGTNVVFKDSVAWQAPMSTWVSDYSPWNNVNYFSTTTVSSFDPNFKEVSPKGHGPMGLIHPYDTVLEYMVHFQNTGSYKATNVVVIDTLDNNLDWTSLRPVYQSAKGQVTLEQKGTYKIATFTFPNIDLPAQIHDDLRSNGMFTYKIKTLSGLPVGTQIRNRAAIYFDYNAPILTNSTLNTISDPSAVHPVSVSNINSFTVYPNPAQESFNTVINSTVAGSADMKVSDITGKILLDKVITIQKGTQTVSTDVNQFASGIYLVSLTQNGTMHTQKLVIVK